MRKVINIVVLIITIIIIIFIKFNYKNNKCGNNSNKSINDIEKYILGINSYETTQEITIKSNKNENKYKVKERYIKEKNNIKILEPKNIEGLEIDYNDNNLKIQNGKDNIVYFLENYKYIGENDLTLSKFIEDYKTNENKSIIKEKNFYIVETENKNGNKYNNYKKLYLNKKDLLPYKLEIKDIAQNVKIYILYNEVKINNLQKEEVLSFKLETLNEDI